MKQSIVSHNGSQSLKKNKKQPHTQAKKKRRKKRWNTPPNYYVQANAFNFLETMLEPIWPHTSPSGGHET